MAELLHSNTALLVVGLVLVALIVLWWLLANRRTRIALAPREEDGPARRNQALIDAPPAAVPPAAVPHAEAGVVPLVEPDASVVLAQPAGPDDLLVIKGLGPKIKAQLADLGITSFAQIAAWSEADIDRIDAQLGRFQGRIRRESWVEQARLLAAGDTDGFARQFGNNG